MEAAKSRTNKCLFALDLFATFWKFNPFGPSLRVLFEALFTIQHSPYSPTGDCGHFKGRRGVET